MREVQTINGGITYISDEDWNYVANLDLYESDVGYIYTFREGKRIGLHRLLLNPPIDKEVDHIDGVKQNNQRDNLRICTRKENAKNRNPNTTPNQYSLYKGVTYRKDLAMWKVQINYPNNIRHHLGHFTNEIAAANCYNHWAKIYYGEFAKLNNCTYMSKDEWKKYRQGENRTSKYRGVCSVNNEWLSQIYHDGKNIKIGKFNCEIDAAEAYDQKAIELKGDNAKLNFVNKLK
jgi:hypothetical protein